MDCKDVVHLKRDYFQPRVSLAVPLLRLIFSFLGDRARLFASTVSKTLNATRDLVELRPRLKKRYEVKKQLKYNSVGISAQVWTGLWDGSGVTCTFCGRFASRYTHDPNPPWSIDPCNRLIACSTECIASLGQIPREDLPAKDLGTPLQFSTFIRQRGEVHTWWDDNDAW